MIFRIWAPDAKRMDVAVLNQRIPMHRDRDGWWSANVAAAGPGADYGFCRDGGQPLPDPRSAWQPHGVHGPSRAFDHGAFAWTDQRWQSPPLSSAVIYELHVGTFTPEGTFESVIPKLDHVAALGVTHVELMPVNQFVGSRGWGYDGVDIYAVHHAYGGPEGLKRLINASHEKGLGVILDVVYNHFGIEGCYVDRFGPYFADWYHTPWGKALNYDGAGSDEVRRFVVDNVIMWLRDYHADGLRIDAVHAILDTSAVHILEQAADEVRALEGKIGRRFFLIAESALNNPRIVRPQEAGGLGMDAQWSDDFHHCVHTVLTGERNGYYEDFGSLADTAKALSEVFVYDGRYSPFRRRRHGRPAGDLSGHRFLAYLQNHDQIGNRAAGERIGHLVSPSLLKVGAALVLTSPYVPMLFQGEEWAASSPFQFFTDYQDPRFGRAVTEGRRKEFAGFDWSPDKVPDPQARETFERSRLNWDEIGREPHTSLLDWYRRLIRLRRELGALSDGRRDRVRTWFDEHARRFAVQRGGVVVACNLAKESQEIPLSLGGAAEVLLASAPGVQLRSAAVGLPAECVAVLRVEQAG